MVKVLVLGPQASGKTSIRYCFFKGSDPSSILRRPPEPAIREEERFEHIEFFLRVVDLGYQESLMDIWEGEEEREFFTAVDAIVFVVDAADAYHRNVLKAIRILQRVASSSSKYSPRAKIHVFLHKMDLVKKDGTLRYLKQELWRAISANLNEEACVFYETSIIDGSSNRALRMVLNEVMPLYDRCREVFDAALRESMEIETIQLLAPGKSETGSRGQALVVAEATSPQHLGEGNGVKTDFMSLLRSLAGVLKAFDDSGIEYSLIRLRNGRLVFLKELGEYYMVVASRRKTYENLFLASSERLLSSVRDIARFTSQHS